MADDVNYEGFGLNISQGRLGNVGGTLQNRIVIQDRIKNVMNFVKGLQEYGPASPAAYANLATGFAENNQKLLRGSAAAIRGFEYPYRLR